MEFLHFIDSLKGWAIAHPFRCLDRLQVHIQNILALFKERGDKLDKYRKEVNGILARRRLDFAFEKITVNLLIRTT